MIYYFQKYYTSQKCHKFHSAHKHFVLVEIRFYHPFSVCFGSFWARYACFVYVPANIKENGQINIMQSMEELLLIKLDEQLKMALAGRWDLCE